MSAIDEVLSANEGYRPSFPGLRPGPPAKKLAIVTCMDARLDAYGVFGLELGDAHVIRNAGGLVTDDVLRSLAISQRALGTREIAVVHHTRCGMRGFDDDAFRAQLAQESGAQPPWRAPGFADVAEDTRRSVETVRSCPWLPHRDGVRGFVFDVETGGVSEVA